MICKKQGVSIVAIIPARGGSKGVKRKNVRDFCGKPLIAWTIEQAKEAKWIDRVIVSTEDEEIAEAAKQYGAEVYIRPFGLAQDTSTTPEVVEHLLTILDQEHTLPTHFVLLQCTSPLRKAEQIDEVIEIMLDHSEDAVVSVREEEHPIEWMRKIDDEGYLKPLFSVGKMYLLRQSYEKNYVLNGAIYCLSTQVFLRERVLITSKSKPYVMDGITSLDIDTEMDFYLAQCIKKALHNYTGQ